MITIAATLGALTMATTPSLVPNPLSVQSKPGTFSLGSRTSIAAGAKEKPLAYKLQGYLAPPTGYEFPIVGRGGSGSIHLRIDPKLALGKEGYKLSVKPDGVWITGFDEAGVFYGIQTLRQLLPAAIYRKGKADEQWTIPCVEVEDKPRFGWRGSMIDTARHFLPKDALLKYIDALSIHKMNVLHLHLVDDQGWRIEIKRFPRLTQIGAWREDSMLTYDPPRFAGKPHGGFYSQDDIREIVAYAAERYITVVPEIEMPGHSQAAIAAYPELGNLSQDIKVWTRWGVNENVFNVEDSTIKFLQQVLDEVMELFPSKFIHIGGDEVPKVQWEKSPRAQERKKQLGLKDEHELQSWFIKQMDAYLASKGRRLIGWDEILEGGLAPGATVMSWRGTSGGIAAAKAGHDVVMSPTSHCYFDYYQSRFREKEPHGIGGFVPLEVVYSYEPLPAELTAEEGKHVLGAQYNLWTEYIPNHRHLEYMAFPRGCALSEVVWSPPSRKDYNDFSSRLPAHLERLKVLDVNFRPLDSAEPPRLGSWRTGDTTEEWKSISFDVTSVISEGDFKAMFSYTVGAHRLEMRLVELLENGVVISRDEHAGMTGGAERDNTYRLSLPAKKPGAKYTLRASVRSDGGSDSNGVVYYLKGG